MCNIVSVTSEQVRREGGKVLLFEYTQGSN